MDRNTAKENSENSIAAIAAASSAAQAAQTAAVSAAVVGENIKFIKEKIGNIEGSISDIKGMYVTKLEFGQYKNEISEISSKVESTQKFIWISMGAVSIIAFVAPTILKFFVN